MPTNSSTRTHTRSSSEAQVKAIAVDTVRKGRSLMVISDDAKTRKAFVSEVSAALGQKRISATGHTQQSATKALEAIRAELKSWIVVDLDRGLAMVAGGPDPLKAAKGFGY